MWKKQLQYVTVPMIALIAAAVAAGCVCVATAADPSDERQQELIEVLLSDSPKPEKASPLFEGRKPLVPLRVAAVSACTNLGES